MAASAAIQALTICLSRANVSSGTRAAASRLCSGLAQRPGLGHTLSHQDLAHSTFSRRQAAYQVVEAGQASGAPSGSGASGGSGGSGGQPPWQRMVGALDKKQPEAAYREFMQLLERGILPPNAVCDRLISGEAAAATVWCRRWRRLPWQRRHLLGSCSTADAAAAGHPTWTAAGLSHAAVAATWCLPCLPLACSSVHDATFSGGAARLCRCHTSRVLPAVQHLPGPHLLRPQGGCKAQHAGRQPHRSGVEGEQQLWWCWKLGGQCQLHVTPPDFPGAAAMLPAGCCVPRSLQMGDLEAALDTFRDLQSLGLTANVVTYCGLISALGKERRRGVRYAQTAHELWAELAGSGAQLDGAAYRTGAPAVRAVVGRHWEWQEQLLLQGHDRCVSRRPRLPPTPV